MRREDGGGKERRRAQKAQTRVPHLVVLEEVHYPSGEPFHCIILLLHHPSQVQLDITHWEWREGRSVGRKGGREGGREGRRD